MADVIPIVQEFLDDMRGGEMNQAPVVLVEQGELRGRAIRKPSGKCHYSFHGIPYAKPPVGSLRFKAPQPPEPWKGVFDATSEGNDSAQIDPLIHKKYVGDEDCLYLNIYTPNLDGEFLPVMIFIHGGGFYFGSGSAFLYGGDYLIEKDVILVTLNYRCGPLGFLCLNTPEVPGNAGIKDIVQAIRWVKQNINAFGGNAKNITVFGESAGGAISSLLTASPLTKDLISKVILQSGTALHDWSWQKDPLDNARRLAKHMNWDSEDDDQLLQFLTKAPAKDIVEAHAQLHTREIFYEKNVMMFAPVVEKEFFGVEAVITEPFIDILTSGRLVHIPTMIGSTSLEVVYKQFTDDFKVIIPEELKINMDSEEVSIVSEKIKHTYFKDNSPDEFNTLMSDKLFNKDVHRYVNYLVQNMNQPVFFYVFDYVGELNTRCLGDENTKGKALHMDELGYLFKNYKQEECKPSPEDLKIKEIMLSFWTNFAKVGNPTPDDNEAIDITWLPVTKDNIYYLNIASDLSLGINPNKERMELWTALYNKYYKVWNHNIVQIKEDDNILKSSEVAKSLYVNNEQVDKKESLVEESEEHVSIETEVKHEVVVESIVETTYSTIEESHQTKEKEDVESIRKNFEYKTKIIEKTNGQNGLKDSNWIHNGGSEDSVDNITNNVTLSQFNINRKPRTSNEIKMLHQTNGEPKDVVRANDPPEDDLPKNIGVNKFVNFFESLGGKK